MENMRTPLRRMREANGLTISEVAVAVQIDVGNLSRIERGIQVTSIETAEKISQFFKGKISEMQILFPHRYAQESEID